MHHVACMIPCACNHVSTQKGWQGCIRGEVLQLHLNARSRRPAGDSPAHDARFMLSCYSTMSCCQQIHSSDVFASVNEKTNGQGSDLALNWLEVSSVLFVKHLFAQKGAPVHSSQSTTPREYTSARCEQRFPQKELGCLCIKLQASGTLPLTTHVIACWVSGVSLYKTWGSGCHVKAAVSSCKPCRAQRECLRTQVTPWTLLSPPRPGCRPRCWTSGSLAACRARHAHIANFSAAVPLPAALQGVQISTIMTRHPAAACWFQALYSLQHL